MSETRFVRFCPANPASTHRELRVKEIAVASNVKFVATEISDIRNLARETIIHELTSRRGRESIFVPLTLCSEVQVGAWTFGSEAMHGIV